MRILFSTLLLFSILVSCKKEQDEVEHEVQLQSNVTLSAATYTLTVDGANHTDLNTIHKLKTDATIHWDLERDTSTVWLTATIYVDGKAVISDAGYKDIELNWVVK